MKSARVCGGFLAVVLLGGCAPGETPKPSALLSACEVPGEEDDRPIEARCGALTVLENPADSTGRQIDLRILVIPSVSATAADPIFYFEGGPGGSSVDAARVIAEYVLPKAGTDRDLVFVDQRGTGASNPLLCPEPGHQDLQSLLTPGLDPARAQACIEAIGEHADVTFYSTAHAADDIEAVRRALGYNAINLLGSSYGTRLALSYMRRHPESVRSAVLVSVVPTDMRIPQTTASDVQQALDSIVAGCKADEKCGAAFPDLERDVAKAERVVREAPIRITIKNPVTEEAETAMLTHDGFVASMRALLYEPWSQRLLPHYFARAAAGDYRPFAEEYASVNASYGDESYADGLYYTITCSEDVDFVDWSEATRLSRETLYGDLRICQYSEICADWPRAALPDGFTQPIVRDTPTLILSGSLDPVTPPELGSRVASHLSDVRHIVVQGDGHNVGEAWPSCGQSLVAEFYATLDHAALNTTCLDSIALPEWSLPASATDPEE